jgi:DNA-binding transcriptional LysR family regulator
MRAIRVGQVRRVLCASPSYLAEQGTPIHPSELIHRNIVAASGVTPAMDWKFAQVTAVRVKPRLTITSNEAAIEAVINGMGITRLLSYQIDNYLKSHTLQTLLTGFEPPPLPIHVIHREGRYASAKVRSFVDLMVAKLRSHQALS